MHLIPGGRGIVRVDVSSDNGQTWHTADIRRVPGQTVAGGRAWAWSLWRCEVPVEVGVEAADVCVRAVDSSYNTQPENTRALWNLRGILNNAWHTRSIALDDQ
jgi:sulfite oxidase